MIAEKIRHLYKFLLAQKNAGDAEVAGINIVSFPNDFAKHQLESAGVGEPKTVFRNSLQTANRIISEKINNPNSSTSERLSKFFSSKYKELLHSVGLDGIPPEYFSSHFSFEQFQTIFEVKEMDVRDYSHTVTSALSDLEYSAHPMIYNESIIFSGWRIIVRKALEDTGAYVREVVNFKIISGRIEFDYWFLAKGSNHASSVRKNSGVVVPLSEGYLAIGTHQSEHALDPRARIMILERPSGDAHEVLDRVQIGLLASLNPRNRYPVCTKMVWLPFTLSEPVRDSEIESAFVPQLLTFCKSGEELFDIKLSSNESSESYCLQGMNTNDSLYILRALENSIDPEKDEYVLSMKATELAPAARKRIAETKIVKKAQSNEIST